MDNLVEYWDNKTVASWLNGLGYGQYEKKFKDHDITGEVLLNADHGMLKELKIKTVGHRLAILKAIKKLKSAQGYEDSQSEDYEYNLSDKPSQNATGTALENAGNPSSANDTPMKSPSGMDVMSLYQMIKQRDIVIDQLFEKLRGIQSEVSQMKELLAKQESSGNILRKKSSRFSKSSQYYAVENSPGLPQTAPAELQHHNSQSASGVIRVYGHKLDDHENESYKTIPINFDDICSSVLPKALTKWKIVDDWKSYALFVKFDGNVLCLSYDDRPLELYRQLSSKYKMVFFYLQAIRTTDSMNQLTSIDRHSQYLENLGSTTQLASTFTGTQNSAHHSRELFASKTSLSNNPEGYDAANELAVAIYEYQAERDDELDVNIGDEFIIRDKTATGWWVVEKNNQVGWVPEGCLLQKTEDVEAEDSEPKKGVALFDYVALGVNEMSIKQNDTLIVHKKYQHWLLAECNEVQGWVPSCFVSIDESTNEKPQAKVDSGEGIDALLSPDIYSDPPTKWGETNDEEKIDNETSEKDNRPEPRNVPQQMTSLGSVNSVKSSSTEDDIDEDMFLEMTQKKLLELGNFKN